MRIIISPAKKMNRDLETLEYRQLPQFLVQAQQILEILASMSREQLKELWKCNDQITNLNYERIQEMTKNMDALTPAVLAYEGIQYQYMAPAVFERSAYEYVEEHLRILSGFYGILRPFDGVVPYRLEMQARLSVNGSRNLYDFWGNRIARQLCSETDCIVNLASKEYSKCVEKYLKEDFAKDIRFVTCVFGELCPDGRVREKGTYAKMARGEMVRFMAETRVEKPEQLKEFARLGYQFCETSSTKNKYVFII